MFLTKEEIAKRRLNYESGKRMGPTVTIAPTEVLKYLDEIESRDIQIDELRNELSRFGDIPSSASTAL